MAQSYSTMAIPVQRPAASAQRSAPPRIEPEASLAARDAAWVARAVAGDRDAEELLYRAHVDAVTGLALRLLGRSHEAEDVVQDVFVAALTRLSQLRDTSAFRGWLMRITVHEVHRRFRRRKLLRVLGFDQGRDGDDASLQRLAAPQLSLDARVELARVDAVLHELPARERTAWMLRHVEGLELTEVAHACGSSLASIKRWLSHAEARVRAHTMHEVPHD